MTYEGVKYYLTDDETKRHVVFLKGDCVIDLYVHKTSDYPYRTGAM